MNIDKNIILENYNNNNELIKYVSKILKIHIERLKIIEKYNNNNENMDHVVCKFYRERVCVQSDNNKFILNNQFILIISDDEIIYIDNNKEFQNYQSNNILKKYIIFEDCCKSFIVCKKTLMKIEKYKKMKSIILIRDEELLNTQLCDKIKLIIDDLINKNNIKNSLWKNGNNVNCIDIPIDEYKYGNNTLKDIDSEIFTIINKLVQLLYDKYFISCTGDAGYNLRKIFGLTRLHSDNILDDNNILQKRKIRNMSIIISLNDDYEGGEFYFPKQDYKIKLKKGDILCFPPYHTHPHMVYAPINNTYRYTINTWLYQ